MSRYIDAELIPYGAVIGKVNGEGENIISTTNNVVTKEAIDKMPTADVAEVRHGHWSKEMYECVDAFGDRHIGYLCSSCKQVANIMNYCGNCGAIMDEKEE